MASDHAPRPGPVLGRPGLDRLPGLRARALRARRDDRLRPRPAPAGRARGPARGARAAAPAVPALGAAARRGPRPRPVAARPDRRHAPTAERENEMNAGGLPNSFVPGRNLLFFTFAATVADRRGLSVLVGGMCETDFSGLPRLPRQHAQVAAGRAQPRPRHGDDDRHAADVARQGRDLGDDREARRRAADRAGRRAHPLLLSRRPRAPPRLGLRLRHVPVVRPARQGLRDLARELGRSAAPAPPTR